MPPASLPVPAKRALPSKEASLFRELLTLYETRQLKKAQKTADQILKKFPEHGETLCMKGLVLTHMGKREDGIDLVKKGMRLDLTSHICWHVFGLIQKGEKNYEEALKSYTQALRFDKENLNILRDAAHLQTQLRNFDGLVETRHTLLRLRPALRQNWIGLAVAYHLHGDLEEAKKVLERYENIVKEVPDYDAEHSEIMLYHVRLLEELGELSEALSVLDVNAKARAIVDRTAVMENRARLLTKLGNTDEAEHAWRALIQQNPDSHDYYHGFLANRGIDTASISDDTRTKSVQTLREFSEQIPRATAPRRLALMYSTGDEFKELVQDYLMTGLSKGIPSLFVDIKTLYDDAEKQTIIQGLLESWQESLVSNEVSPFRNTLDSSSSSSEPEPPTTYLWILYFLAQHYCHLGQHCRSISLLDQAISHTPTLPELHACKARVLKHAGDAYGSARSLNDARLLDLQDRFLNTKCAKYRLRAGFPDEAQEVLGLFTKKDAISPAADLEDMQSLLFLVEDGDAYNRIDKLGPALKRYISVKKVFDEVEDDQYDFHGYSLRKFTVNIYLNLVTWEDRLRSHPSYIHAALEASRIFIRVHDDSSLITLQATTAPLSDAEKKAKKKAKKAASKVQEESKKSVTSPANEDKGLELPVAKDEDPEGMKLLSSPDGLERAAKLLQPLTYLTKKADVWVVVYDVTVRRKKYLQAVKALNHVYSLDPEDPELHIRLADFRTTLTSLPQLPPSPIGTLVASSLAKLLPDEMSLETFNSQYLQRHTTSAPHILAVAKVAQKLGASEEELDNIVFLVFEREVTMRIKDALRVAAFLAAIGSSRVHEFRSKCDAKFELSTAFKTSAEQEALRQGVCDSSTDGGDKEEVVA